MEVQEFVQNTLVQIARGISEAQQIITKESLGEGIDDSQYRSVKFDMAVTTSESDSKELGGKITVASVFSVGGSGEKEQVNTNVSRIQFEVLLNVKTH